MKFDRAVRPAYAVVVLVLITCALGFRAAVSSLNLYMRKEAVALREPLDSIPTKLGRWRRYGADGRMGGAMVESLGTNQYLDRQYALDGDPAKGIVTLHIAYYTGMVDAVPHVPERCWGAAGMAMVSQPEAVLLQVDSSAWDRKNGPLKQGTDERYPLAMVSDPVTRRDASVTMPLGEALSSVTVFQDGDRPGARMVGGYLFVANGRLAATPYVVRTYAFDLSNRYAYYCKVQFSAILPESGQEVQQWTAMTSELLTELFPYLMRCLPDWPSLESPEMKES